MSTQAVLPPIPWVHSQFDFGSVWKWQTPHFVVTVNGDARSCYWQISDLSTGTEKPFADGRSATFQQTEREVRETIGKAYPPRLGYQTFAGSLATTFTISTGERIDLGPFVGQHVVATVVAGDASSTHEGLASIENYDFVVTNNGTAVRISPTYLVNVKAVYRPTPRQVNETGNRVYSGRVELGCTGRPGYLPNTIEHDSALCPIHEKR